MKTALQELIDKFEDIRELDYYVQILILRGECHRLAQLEKQQIIDAYIEASPRLEDITKESAEEYFNKTYN